MKADDTDAVRERGRGALLGLAVGDALGTTLEFEPRDRHPLHTEMTGGGPFRLAAGRWTDDTAMALALADSLIDRKGLDPHDLMERFVGWWRKGRFSCTGTYFDIGITTRQALARFEQTGEPFAGSIDPRTAGNGSLMRLAPVALFALRDPMLADQVASDQSRTTHGAEEAVGACVLFARILRETILGVLDPQASQPWGSSPAIQAVARGDWHSKDRSQISSSGYVVDTLEAALWCVGTTSSFEDALVLAVNLGSDADTVGAVTGQLAGALYGMNAIPRRWLERLAWREQIVRTADLLLDVSPSQRRVASRNLLGHA